MKTKDMKIIWSQRSGTRDIKVKVWQNSCRAEYRPNSNITNQTVSMTSVNTFVSVVCIWHANIVCAPLRSVSNLLSSPRCAACTDAYRRFMQKATATQELHSVGLLQRASGAFVATQQDSTHARSSSLLLSHFFSLAFTHLRTDWTYFQLNQSIFSRQINEKLWTDSRQPSLLSYLFLKSFNSHAINTECPSSPPGSE